MKKLYRVTLSTESHRKTDAGLVFSVEFSRAFEVIARDVTQAVRKAKYHLTKNKSNFPVIENEFIDSVERIGVIHIN